MGSGATPFELARPRTLMREPKNQRRTAALIDSRSGVHDHEAIDRRAHFPRANPLFHDPFSCELATAASESSPIDGPRSHAS